LLENIRLAFRGIWSHKMRSFLTMLGIIIGIAAIIAIVSTIRGTNEQIKNNLVGSGNNTVKVQLSQGGYALDISDASSIPSNIPMVTEDTLENIKAIDTVESVTAYNSRMVYDKIYYKDNSISELYIYGIDDSYFSTCSYMVRTGREFSQDDYTKFRTVMILDTKAANGLFGDENPLGKVVELSGVPFTVVGVVQEKRIFEPQINSIDDYYTYNSSDKHGFIYIPKADWPIVYDYDEPENVVVKAASTDDMTDAGKKTASILNRRIRDLSSDSSDTIKYSAEDLLEQAQSLQQLSSTTNMQLIWIAGISLLVGGIGVMNIMLVSVTERTSEIGLKKALGARKRTILGQFLTEAAVLTSLGGLLGVAAGIGFAYIIHHVSGVAVAIDVPASIIAVAFSMVIGIVFGFLPSVQAANLDPIEALRRE